MTYGQRWINEIIGRSRQIYDTTYLQLELVDSVDKWNQLVTRRHAMKGIVEHGKRNLHQKLYHHRDIVEQYGH
jgi:hypothetical protein